MLKKCFSLICFTQVKQKRTSYALLFVASSSNINNTLLQKKKKLWFYFCPLLSQMPEFQCEKSLDLLGSKGELRATVVWYKKPGSTTLAFSALKNRHLCLSRILCYTLLYTSIEQKQKRTPCALLFVASSSNANNTLLQKKKKLCFYFCPLLSQSSRGYSVTHPPSKTF